MVTTLRICWFKSFFSETFTQMLKECIFKSENIICPLLDFTHCILLKQPPASLSLYLVPLGYI